MIRKLTIYIFLLLALSQKTSAKVYTVATENEFKAIQTSLLPGDEVSIKNGNYSNWSLQISNSGTAAKPIVIRAEKPGGVSFSGRVIKTVFMVSGNYILIKGIDFKNCILEKEAGNTGTLIVLNQTSNCRIEDCNFSDNQAKVQFTPLVIVAGNGSSNNISHCSFTSNIDNQDVQVKVTKESFPKFTLIQNNLFSQKAKVSWKNGNGGECVQVGQDPVLLGNQAPETTVSGNRFIHCDAENEVISNKSSGNKYLNNYFENNDGELVMRGGHDCIIAGNTFKGGTGGIRINGTGHQIINNKIAGIATAIRLMYGMAKGKEEIGFYIAASGCTLKNNRISNATTGILVGDSKNVDWTGKFDTKRYPSPVMQNIAPFDNNIMTNTFKNVKTEISEK